MSGVHGVQDVLGMQGMIGVGGSLAATAQSGPCQQGSPQALAQQVGGARMMQQCGYPQEMQQVYAAVSVVFYVRFSSSWVFSFLGTVPGPRTLRGERAAEKRC